MASCRPGVFLFLWGSFGSYWPEVQPRCRSPPISFRSLVNQQPKRRSIWLLSICGTITHSIHQIVLWKYQRKLLKCSRNLTGKRRLTACVPTAIKPTIPLTGMMGWSMKRYLFLFLPMNCMNARFPCRNFTQLFPVCRINRQNGFMLISFLE